MLLTWLKKRRADAIHSNVQHLIKQLTERQPSDWRAIDDEVIKWPKAGEMWNDEIRILKKLASYGPVAKSASSAIIQAADQNLWGHCLKYNGRKTLGLSMLAYVGLFVTNHTDIHLFSLQQSLETLTKTGVDDPAAISFLSEVIKESQPPSARSLDFMKRDAQKFLQLGSVRKIPDDVLYRSNIRGFALNLVGSVADSLPCGENAYVELMDVVIGALNDTSFIVRLTAIGSLQCMKSSVCREKRIQAAPRVLSILQSHECIATFGAQRRNLLIEIVAKWEAIRDGKVS